MPTPPTAFWVIAVKATGRPVVIRPSTRLDGIWVARPISAWAGVVKYAIRFTVLVCPGFTSHEVVITTGAGKLFTALSVRLGDGLHRARGHGDGQLRRLGRRERDDLGRRHRARLRLRLPRPERQDGARSEEAETTDGRGWPTRARIDGYWTTAWTLSVPV